MATKRGSRKSPGAANAIPIEDGATAQAELAQAVLGEFRLIFKSVRKHFKSVQSLAGVSGAQLWVLAAIDRQPGIRVTELAKVMSIHQSTASNLIERLEREGLLRRVRDPEDQRVVRLYLPPGAKKIVTKAPGPPEGILPEALTHLSAEELRQLRGLLAKLSGLLLVRDSRGKKTPLSEI